MILFLKFSSLAVLTMFMALYLYIYKEYLKLKTFSGLLAGSIWFNRHAPKWAVIAYMKMMIAYCSWAAGDSMRMGK